MASNSAGSAMIVGEVPVKVEREGAAVGTSLCSYISVQPKQHLVVAVLKQHVLGGEQVLSRDLDRVPMTGNETWVDRLIDQRMSNTSC